MRRDKKTKNHIPGGFAGIPRIVMDHPDYKGLQGNSVKLLMEFSRQYRGNNNGDLTVAYSTLKNHGFNSKNTIKRALKELIDAKLIVQTRTGRFTNPGGVCALFAVTWHNIDECGGKLEIKTTTTSYRKFSLENNKTPGPIYGPGSSSKRIRQRQRNAKGQYSSSSE